MLIISGLGIVAMLAEIFRFKNFITTCVIGYCSAYAFNFMEWNQPCSISYFDNMIGLIKLHWLFPELF
ncbi:MAG: hypothetical protein IPM51_15470 [Sphingobacteriaceae bacterium]|nr:hypothetical protein [Sphingobacteriaceae bacterium]